MPRFENVSCSQCGQDFGPGDHGFSHCQSHRPGGWPPFAEGDIVRIKGNDHLGQHRVDEVEWFTRVNLGGEPYWLCHCTEIREPADWSKIPEGATGVITGSAWSGSADRLEAVYPKFGQ